MTKAILDIFGLGTPITSDGCGLRSFVEGFAESLGFSDWFATWDGAGMIYPVAEAVRRLRMLNGGYDFIALIGHSHGGWRMNECLANEPANSVDIAIYLDEAPVGKPLAWMAADQGREGRLVVPAAAKRAVAFYQRKQAPLCGMSLQPRADGSVKNYCVGGIMPASGYPCGDERLGLQPRALRDVRGSAGTRPDQAGDSGCAHRADAR
jgi:pimeloyl-ACP methyl ester carboxylesterase